MTNQIVDRFNVQGYTGSSDIFLEAFIWVNA